jgi:hypothetical protein
MTIEKAKYKASSTSEQSVVFAPYVPLTFQKADPVMNKWERRLAELHIQSSIFGNITGSQDSIMNAIARMQESYPGNYILVEEYNSVRGKFEYKMQFDTPEDESFFLMKYSDK